MNALRYAAEYVPRALHNKLIKSANPLKPVLPTGGGQQGQFAPGPQCEGDCHEKFGHPPPPKMDPLVHVFRNIWTHSPDISKYLDPHGTNISGIG